MIISSRSTGAMLGFLGQEHWWSEEGRQSSWVRAFLVLKDLCPNLCLQDAQEAGFKNGRAAAMRSRKGPAEDGPGAFILTQHREQGQSLNPPQRAGSQALN